MALAGPPPRVHEPRKDRPIHTSSSASARPVREQAVDAPREAPGGHGRLLSVAVVILKIVFLRSRVSPEDEEGWRRVLRERRLEPPSPRSGRDLRYVKVRGLDVRRQFTGDDVELVALGEGQAVYRADGVGMHEPPSHPSALRNAALVARHQQHERPAGGFEVQRLLQARAAGRLRTVGCAARV